ncbi:addiction module component CHP02574 family protein [Pedobacter psychrophilus]|uniref:addiction module component CHP02574 family protein n=1 Tax=Pedobacter psychrophilus TaxID=1826909 RepID=UPI00083A6874|nr:addiction module component CHP02574 family protein [Pedobacter psychrophilus]
MKLQIIEDIKGDKEGVFIPIEDWARIKANYPDIENLDIELSKWEQELIDNRLKAIDENSERLMDGKVLFEELKRKI